MRELKSSVICILLEGGLFIWKRRSRRLCAVVRAFRESSEQRRNRWPAVGFAWQKNCRSSLVPQLAEQSQLHLRVSACTRTLMEQGRRWERTKQCSICFAQRPTIETIEDANHKLRGIREPGSLAGANYINVNIST